MELFVDDPPMFPYPRQATAYDIYHGTAMASKIGGRHSGTIKNPGYTKIILVSGMGTTGDIFWAWPTILDDINTRRLRGEALQGRTVIVSAQDINPGYKVFNPTIILARMNHPQWDGMKNAMKYIMNVLNVPILQAGGNRGPSSLEFIDGIPQSWVNESDFPVIVVGGIDMSGLHDPLTQKDWPVTNPFSPAGPKITVRAPSSNVNFASSVWDGVFFFRTYDVTDGTTSLATAAAGGTALNILLMNAYQPTPWFDANTNLVRNLWRFVNSGRGSFSRVRGNTFAPRVIYNMLDGSRDVSQCPIAKRQAGAENPCQTDLADNSSSVQPDPASITSDPPPLFTTNFEPPVPALVPTGTIQPPPAIPSLSCNPTDGSGRYVMFDRSKADKQARTLCQKYHDGKLVLSQSGLLMSPVKYADYEQIKGAAANGADLVMNPHWALSGCRDMSNPTDINFGMMSVDECWGYFMTAVDGCKLFLFFF